MNFVIPQRKPWAVLGALLGAAVLLPLGAQAQTLPNWTQPQPGISTPQLAVDAASHSWVVGALADGSLQLTKLSPAGTTVLQRNFAIAGASLRSSGLAVDAAGNLLLSGYRVDATGASQGALLARFDSNGTLLWQDAPLAAYGMAFKPLLDAAGNAYVLNRLVQTHAAGGSTQDITLSKYSPLGQVLWVRSWGASYVQPAEAMALLPGGRVLVAGLAAGSSQAPVAVFDTVGTLLWATSVPSQSEAAVAVAPSGEFAVVGSSGANFMVARFSAAYAPAWVRTDASAGSAQRAAFDSQGNLLVNGISRVGTGFAIVYGWKTVKLDAAGNLLWTHALGSGAFGGDLPAALALGSDNAVYLAGQGRTPQAGGGTLANTTTLKLAANGAPVWQATTGGTGQALGLKLSADGGVLVLGDNPYNLLNNLAPVAQLYRYAATGLANQVPLAQASASPSSGSAPLSVQFSAAGSKDPDGLLASYQWDFGDGQGATVANPTHVYATGSYTARLTVTDTLGAVAVSAPLVISATASTVPAKPTAFTLAAPSASGGSVVAARINVSTTAGVTLLLSSSNTTAARVPASAVVPKGASSVSFNISTLAVRRDTTLTLRASANGASVSVPLTVRKP